MDKSYQYHSPQKLTPLVSQKKDISVVIKPKKTHIFAYLESPLYLQTIK
jgi:hypothetical protein